jgi:hypothetical protein
MPTLYKTNGLGRTKALKQKAIIVIKAKKKIIHLTKNNTSSIALTQTILPETLNTGTDTNDSILEINSDTFKENANTS